MPANGRWDLIRRLKVNKEMVHQVGKQDFYYIMMHGQPTIKKRARGVYRNWL